jgi:hypothetical protein
MDRDDPFKRKLLTCMLTISLYLWATFAFWFPNIVINMYCTINQPPDSAGPDLVCLAYLDASIAVVPYQGVCYAIIYFWRTAEPKRIITKLMGKYFFPSWQELDFSSDGSEMHHDEEEVDENVSRITLDGQFFMVFSRGRGSVFRIDAPTVRSANRIGEIELETQNPVRDSTRDSSTDSTRKSTRDSTSD